MSEHHHNRPEWVELLELNLLVRILEMEKKIMTALETVTASVNANTAGQAPLTAAVNALIVQIGTASPTDAQLLTLATAIDANTANDAALTAAATAALAPATPPPAP